MKKIDLKNLDLKKVGIMLLPVLVIGIALFATTGSDDTLPVSEEEKEKKSSLFFPDSENQDSISGKIEAYDLLTEEGRKKQLELNNSKITQRDFFARMTEDSEISQNSNKEVTEDDLYNFLSDNSDKNNMSSYEDSYEYANYNPTPPKRNNSSRWKVEQGEPIIDYTEVQQTNTPTVSNNQKEENIEQYKSGEEWTKKERERLKAKAEESRKKNRRFFSASSDSKEQGNLISAVIDGVQVVESGQEVKIRITEPMEIEGGIIIPEHTQLSGIVKFSTERVFIDITSVVYGKSRYSIKKEVCALNGMVGLNAPESLKAQMKKETNDRMISEADVNVGSGNILTGSVDAVVDATKSVLRRKNQAVTVELKSNKIYLK